LTKDFLPPSLFSYSFVAAISELLLKLKALINQLMKGFILPF